MTKANSGFVADSGVQAHSAGSDFPITHYSVGGYPRIENDAFWVVCHPAGTKRWCFSAGARDAIIANFKEADEMTKGIDFNVISERIAFEFALLAIDKGNHFKGNLFEDNKRVGW